MGKLIYSNMMTLDGFMAGTDGSLDWAVIDEELHRFVNQEVRDWDAFLYGRRMYEVMAAYWPTAQADPSIPAVELEFAQIWNAKPKLVFSKTLAQVAGNSRLKREVVLSEMLELKQRSPQGLGLGGANLAAAFMQFDLVDEYQIYIHPVRLGEGQPAFQAGTQKAELRLIEARTFGSGVVFLRYQRA